jgi:hypothetical protein
MIVNVSWASCKVKLDFFSLIFEKYNNIKFHGNPFGESRVVTYGRTDGRTDRRIDLTNLIVAFPSFANAPKSIGFWCS